MRCGGGVGSRQKCGCEAAHLTLREIQVLLLVAIGLGSSPIGQRLGISRRTVEDHLAVMRKRAGAHDSAELVARSYAAEVLLPGWPPRWSGSRCLLIRCPAGNHPPGDACLGCRHFRSDDDVSYLPELKFHLRNPLATREHIRSVSHTEDWAKAQLTPHAEEIARLRKLIRCLEADLDCLSTEDVAQMTEAVTVLREARQVIGRCGPSESAIPRVNWGCPALTDSADDSVRLPS
jgi:DNA-binding CsgD family transcriptional regulator